MTKLMLGMIGCLLFAWNLTFAQYGTPFNQRDDEYRLLGLKRAQGAYEAAKAELERNKRLYGENLISEQQLEQSHRNYSDTEVNYQQSLLSVLFEMQYIIVEKATKYQGSDERKHVRLQLVNASGGTAEYKKLINIDDELYHSLKPDVIDNVYVSLLNDDNAIISQPYEYKIDKLIHGQPQSIEFTLLQDLDAVTVNLVYGNGTQRSPKIFLQKDASVDRVIVQSEQFSQEVELGSSATYDLTLELFSGENRTYKLEVVNLPAQLNRYFSDPGSQARLSQFKFTESTNTRRAALQVFLPDRPTDEITIDQSIPFYVLVIPHEQRSRLGDMSSREWSEDEIQSLKVGYVRLELVPRGVGQLLVKAPQLYHALHASENTDILLEVKNEGTRRLDNVRMTVDPPLNWNYTLSPEVETALDVGKTGQFRLNISAPANVAVGKYEIRVKTNSFADNQPISGEDKTITVEILPETNVLGMALVILLILGLIAGIVIFGIRLSRR